MVNKDKKFIINEGRAITNGKFAYGGFPRILSEENNSATDRFQDSPNQGQVDVATKPNEEEDLRADMSGLRYPDAEYKKLHQVMADAFIEQGRASSRSYGKLLNPQAYEAATAAFEAAKKAVEAHPRHKEFKQASEASFNRVRGSGLGN